MKKQKICKVLVKCSVTQRYETLKINDRILIIVLRNWLQKLITKVFSFLEPKEKQIKNTMELSERRIQIPTILTFSDANISLK